MLFILMKYLFDAYMGLFGAICSLTGFIYLVFKNEVILNPFRSFWIYLIIFVISLIKVWYCELRKIAGVLDNSDIRITIKFGNIFRGKHNIFIPMNSKLVSCFSNSTFVSKKSVQGQAISRHYLSDPKRLDAQLQALLQERHPECKAPYAPGFTVTDKIGNLHYYFVVTAEINEKGASNTTEEFIIQALENFWDYLDDNPSNDLPLSLPLIGCGQGRLIDKKERMLRTICQSFITHIRKKKTSSIKELRLYIPLSSIFQGSVDIVRIKQFIGYVCSEPFPDKNFLSRGIEG